jgi:LSU ribosomal protein L37AE
MSVIVPFSHTKIVGPIGRFGARYGMGVRRKVLQIEVKQRVGTDAQGASPWLGWRG